MFGDDWVKIVGGGGWEGGKRWFICKFSAVDKKKGNLVLMLKINQTIR